MGRVFVTVPVLAGILLLHGACATKRFVMTELQRSETRTEQQLRQLETELGQQKAQVSQVGSQVTEVRALSEETIRLARRALARGDEALAKAEGTDNRLSRLWANRNKRNLVQTVIVTFGFDRWQPDDRAQTVLRNVVNQLRENPSLTVDLEGYTDIIGPLPYNLRLSQFRVEAVQRFLAEKGVDLPRIHSVGLGPANPVADNRREEGRAQNRRVVIKVFSPTQ